MELLKLILYTFHDVRIINSIHLTLYLIEIRIHLVSISCLSDFVQVQEELDNVFMIVPYY